MVLTRNLLFSVVLVFLFFGSLAAIRCYQCGSEAIFMDYDSSPIVRSNLEQREDTLLTLESCSSLENSFSSWGTYTVDCNPDEICVKTTIDEGFDENGKHHYATGSRGCAMRNTSFGKIHEMGCGIFKTNLVPAPPPDTSQTFWDLVCFCDYDYCNGVVSHPPCHVTVVLLSLLTCYYMFR